MSVDFDKKMSNWRIYFKGQKKQTVCLIFDNFLSMAVDLLPLTLLVQN
jgi:hypothetical protein